MYSIGITHSPTSNLSRITAHVMARLCRRSGFDAVSLEATEAHPLPPPTSPPDLPWQVLSANTSRILCALGLEKQIAEQGFQPDREQLRLASSGFLLAETPLGAFAADRYGARLFNIASHDLEEICRNPLPGPADTSPRLYIHAHLAAAAPVPSHDIYAAHLPGMPNRANITWLGDDAIAWQASLPQGTGFLFCVPVAADLDTQRWHASLAEAVHRATRLGQVSLHHNNVREQWFYDREVYVGCAASVPNLIRPETHLVGLEDAWVLSRMLENYEEAVHEGLAVYERYRKPRNRKLQAFKS